MTTWNLKGIPEKTRRPVTDSDVYRLNEYLELIKAKNKLESEITALEYAHASINYEKNNALEKECNIRHRIQEALINLQEIIDQITYFKF